MDMKLFLRNRQNFPPEELAKYAGRFVAWSPDGARIVACAKDEPGTEDAARKLGFDPAEILVSYVPSSDETLLGGGEVSE